MPKLELGDLQAIEQLKEREHSGTGEIGGRRLGHRHARSSCTLMFKQELPLMFPDDPQVLKVRDAMFDPFEYLWARYRGEPAEHRLPRTSSARSVTTCPVTCACRISV